MTLHENLIDAIGDTPLLRLQLGKSDGVRVYAKLEMQNLYGMKDRVARQVILAAKRSGELAPAAPIVESSSGTMALGVALVGRALDHPVHIVTDPRIDPITRTKLESLGARVDVVQSMTSHGWQSARLERLEELMRDLPGAFCPRQYSNPHNPAAYRTLAAELRADLGGLDVLVGAVGSGGSLCGTSRGLRETGTDPWVVGVDSVGSVLFDQPDRPGRLQSGLGNSMRPDNLDRSMIDEVHWLNDREAFTATTELALEQGIFGGNTSGSVYRVLRHVSERSAPGTRIVGIFPDRGDRYARTVYAHDYLLEHDIASLGVAAAPERVEMGKVVSSWSCAIPRPATDRPMHLRSQTHAKDDLSGVEHDRFGDARAPLGVPVGAGSGAARE